MTDRELDAFIAERVCGLEVWYATGTEWADHEQCAMPKGEPYTVSLNPRCPQPNDPETRQAWTDTVRVPRYSTDLNAVAEAEKAIAKLAHYNGGIVQHIVHQGSSTQTRGLCLWEPYIMALMREVGVVDTEVTCMGENNWVRHRFRTSELGALATATAQQRARAMVKVIGGTDGR